jgi:hypothetical protein
MSGTASCQLTFTPAAGGSYAITGSYNGDGSHHQSQGTGPLTAKTTTTRPPPGRGSLTISGSAKVLRKGVAAVPLSCSGSPREICAGTLTLTTSVKTKVRRNRKTVTETKTITLGSGRYSLAAGSSKTLSIALSKAGVKLLDQAAGHGLKAKSLSQLVQGRVRTSEALCGSRSSSTSGRASRGSG